LEGRALVSYFKMPFRKGAKIEIENQTGNTIQAFYYYVDYIETEIPDNSGYFHAWYNHEITATNPEGENEWGTLPMETGINPDGRNNYLFMETQGKGMFVGVNYYVNNPGPMWYGEGDDMFYIDDSKMPTLNGTGTEDYFNTSWSPKTAFSHPYFGYPRVNGTLGWLGRTHVYRFHIEDPVYFDKSLKFSIEHGHNNCLTLDLASVAYWYLDKPTKLAPIATRDERQFMPEITVVDIHRWRNDWRQARGNGTQLWGNEGIVLQNAILKWHIIGPFTAHDKDAGFSEVFTPEKEFNPDKAFVNKDDTEINWQEITIKNDGIIDFDRWFGQADNKAAYAHVYVWSPKEKTFELKLGSDDGVKVWVNNQEIFKNEVQRALVIDQDKMQVLLHNGWNDLLIKVVNISGEWELILHFIDPDKELRYSLKKDL
jgi:hypothetical protein